MRFGCYAYFVPKKTGGAGKRRLLALEESMEQELDWVRAFYVIRMQAEGLMEKE